MKANLIFIAMGLLLLMVIRPWPLQSIESSQTAVQPLWATEFKWADLAAGDSVEWLFTDTHLEVLSICTERECSVMVTNDDTYWPAPTNAIRLTAGCYDFTVKDADSMKVWNISTGQNLISFIGQRR